MTDAVPSAHAVLLAGGSGTRLWPFSRSLLPKQLQSFLGDITLLQQTVARTLELFPPERVWVVTTEELVFEVRSQLRALHPVLEGQVLVEPVGRNTLPAILLGMDRALRADPDALVAVFPSDHLVHRPDAWQQALTVGLALARDGWLVTFGVVPHRPETGYGYIELGEPLGGDAWQTARFVEKPDLPTARGYLEGGRHLWNSGMFVFDVGAFVGAVRAHQPELAAWWATRDRASLTDGYADLPSVSVDYGVLEHAPRQAVLRTDFGWDDLGSWEAVYSLGAKDPSDNVIRGDVLALDCADSLLVSSGGGKLAAVGLRDLVVVQTRDATLVCPRGEVQRVKDVVHALRAQDSKLVEAHVTVRRPWGTYTVLEEGPFYKIKRLVVRPGASLSLQRHLHRSEHWVVIRGTAEVHLDGEVTLLYEDQSVDIPKTSTHRLGNPGRIPCEIIEIQSGAYLEEDDITRLAPGTTGGSPPPAPRS